MNFDQFEKNNGKRPTRPTKSHDAHLGATESGHYGSGQAGSAVGWDDDAELMDYYGFFLPHRSKNVDV